MGCHRRDQRERRGGRGDGDNGKHPQSDLAHRGGGRHLETASISRVGNVTSENLSQANLNSCSFTYPDGTVITTDPRGDPRPDDGEAACDIGAFESGRPIATTTSLSSSANPSVVGQQVIYAATVSPVPDGGTVAFSDGGTLISGCDAQPVNMTTGTATCTVASIADVARTYALQARAAHSHSADMYAKNKDADY